MKVLLRLTLALGIFLVLLSGCQKEKFFEGNTNLKFSTDTVWFDTVFTKAPGTKYPISVTKIFSITNPENGTVKVDLTLAGGVNSAYRINADGFAGPEIRGLEIPAKDSIFVFVQCTLEPNNQTMPALLVDSLIATVNGKSQKTYLAAFGWDANYFQSVQLACNEVWGDKTKPYVIVDNVLVAKGCTFTIKEGVTVYNSARSLLLVQGTLKIEGTAAEPVYFTGDKPTFEARELPNQWGGIYITRGSTNNKIAYAKIHNAAIGIRVDSLPEAGNWNLEIESSSMLFCGQAGLAGITAKIKAQNCLIGESGSYSFLGFLGGEYEFRHCTFVGYANFTTRQDGHFALTNTIRDGNGIILQSKPLTCTVLNSIIYGSQKEEFYIDNKGFAAFTTNITNNLIRSFDQPYAGNVYNQTPEFNSTTKHEFWLGSNSPAKDAGTALSPAITLDILGKTRDANVDLGCYEYIP
ncbi:MAG: hypothetical protein IT244_00145 [Bacteroidia bacterium]|nr:hypothetical protein [Bacteroidia bacterium]